MSEAGETDVWKNWVIVALCLLLALLWFRRLGQYQDLEKVIDSLRQEVQALKAANEELKHGAQRLLAEAKQGISKGNWTMVETQLKDLIERHPQASETVEARILLLDVESERKKQEAILAAKSEQEAQKKMAEEMAEKKKIEAELKEQIAKKEKAIQHMKKRVDKFEGITWFHDKSVNESSSRSNIYIYFGQKGSSVVGPRLRIQYGGDDWLFVQEYKFQIDGTPIQFGPKDVKRDHDGGHVWEWSDDFIDDNIWPTVEKIANGKNVAIRFIGNQYHHDRDIPSSEKAAIKRTLDAFLALKESR